jgi:hypothetical protein
MRCHGAGTGALLPNWFDVSFLGRTSTMRWKIRPSGHDPRQIDLLAALAILIVIAAVGHYLSEPAKTRATSSFIEPSQSVRW